MVSSLIVVNFLAGLLVALAFGAKAIVVIAPLLAVATFAVLWFSGMGGAGIAIYLLLCVVVSQASFLLGRVVLWLGQKKGRGVRQTPYGDDGAAPEAAASPPRDDIRQA